MAGGNETPRQRMIGILYLVLLGLIALNVPDSLLDAFKNIKNSLDTSTANVQKGIETTYSTFENTKLKDQPQRAKPILDKAKKASDIAKSLNDYVQQLRDKLIAEGGGINPTINDVSARDNLDISPRIMITQKNGEQLRDKINQTRDQLLALLTPAEKKGVNFSLNADAPDQTAGQGPKKTWEEAYFGDGIPLGATLTTLAKIQTDDKNAENEVVKRILGEVDQAQVNLDQFAAVAVAPSSYVLLGQPYTAQVFLTAYDSKLSPDITVGGSPIHVEAGKGVYTGSTGSEGLKTWSAKIRVKQNDGTFKEYDTPPQSYMVAKPSAVVSPDKMNVFYIGVPNPVSVSAPGISKSDISVSMSGGSISPSGNGYTVKVSSLGTATVNVSGKVSGKSVNLGSSVFRVKRIPDPKAVFAGKSGGNTSAANIRGQDRLFAKLENFDFDAKFNVTRFTLLIAKPRQDAVIYTTSSGELSGPMRTAMGSVTPGTTVVFKDIIAVGPDGSPRGLDAIVLSAN